jgi:hypothetical protein
MGSNKMANSLIFMAYSDSTGKNITLSPRLVYGNVEPVYTSNLSVAVLPGSGIANDQMTVNAKCTNCRSWKGGSIDPTNTAAQFIFAVGPDGSLNSNSGSANTKRHSEYGAFTMDLTKALGVAGVPVAMTADSAGTTQTQLQTDHDFGPPLHAVILSFVFVGLMPFGIVFLRIFHSVKLHALNQTLSAAGAILGGGLGIYIGTMYNRVSNSNPNVKIDTDGTTVQELRLSPSNLRHRHHNRHDRAVGPRIHAPQTIQADSASHQARPLSRLARSNRHPLRHRQRLPGLPSRSEPQVQLGTSSSHPSRHHRTRPLRILALETQQCAESEGGGSW